MRQGFFEGLEVKVHQAGVVGLVDGGEALEAAFEVEAEGIVGEKVVNVGVAAIERRDGGVRRQKRQTVLVLHRPRVRMWLLFLPTRRLLLREGLLRG